MRLEMECKGLEELVKAFEKAASDAEIRETNRKIVEKSEPVVKRIMSEKIPKSDDHSKSGRWYKYSKTHKVPDKRAADSVPIGKIQVKGTGASAEVGWDKSDTSEHFYVKFINWGTVKQPPREFIYATGREADSELQNIAEKEYQAFLDNMVKEG